MAEETRLIRRIARELRYGSLDDLTSREVTINNLDSVEKDIRDALFDVQGEAIGRTLSFTQRSA